VEKKEKKETKGGKILEKEGRTENRGGEFV
jgi:hypothetical protein